MNTITIANIFRASVLIATLLVSMILSFPLEARPAYPVHEYYIPFSPHGYPSNSFSRDHEYNRRNDHYALSQYPWGPPTRYNQQYRYDSHASLNIRLYNNEHSRRASRKKHRRSH